jgi:hypothetical protein
MHTLTAFFLKKKHRECVGYSIVHNPLSMMVMYLFELAGAHDPQFVVNCAQWTWTVTAMCHVPSLEQDGAEVWAGNIRMGLIRCSGSLPMETWVKEPPESTYTDGLLQVVLKVWSDNQQ